MSDEEWEVVAVLPDCALAVLGDDTLLDDDTWLEEGSPCLIVRPDGRGILHAIAECDGLPVEVVRQGDAVVAVRLEFVDDVRDVEEAGEGRWETVGRVHVGDAGVLAVDMKMRHRDEWREHVPLQPGWYRAETFDADGECVGIRLVSE